MKLASTRFIAFLGFFAFNAFQPVSIPASTIRDDQPDSGYTALAADPAFAAVGTFVNSYGYTGAGILIAPDWVLTAAHMLVAATSGTFTINGVSYTSTQVIGNPGWNENNPFGGYDFGLVHLSSSVTAIPPAAFYTGTSEFGQVGTFVGYGFTGTGLTGYTTLDGQKRAFQNVIDGNFGNPSILLASDFDNPGNAADNGFGSATPLLLEGCVAPGDSGGGVFISDGTRYYLAGVISFVANADGSANSDYGDASGFGRVSTFLPWIISTVPEPSTSALLVSFGLAMFLWRFQKKQPRAGRK